MTERSAANISIRSLSQCAIFAALIAIGAFIKIPLPIMPITLQTLFVNLAGLLLGSRRGALATGCYVVLGLLGLPVFVSGGGIAYVLQPTFGYLLGFIAAAWLSGRLVERNPAPSFRSYLLASFANLALIYLVGLAYMYGIRNFYLQSPMGFQALILGAALPFLPGDILLCLLSPHLARRLAPLMRRG